MEVLQCFSNWDGLHDSLADDKKICRIFGSSIHKIFFVKNKPKAFYKNPIEIHYATVAFQPH